jgi:plastocyanin
MRRAFLLGILLALCTLSTASAQTAGSIKMTDDSFDQTELHVAAGTPVIWVNSSSQTHTVTADDATFDSTDMPSGNTYTMIFPAPGSYAYYCQYHGDKGGVGMSGVIVVE